MEWFVRVIFILEGQRIWRDQNDKIRTSERWSIALEKYLFLEIFGKIFVVKRLQAFGQAVITAGALSLCRMGIIIVTSHTVENTEVK